jgi:M6 family metalloprotease-like protein
LLRLHGEIQRAAPAQAALLRAQAAPVIEQRGQALSALIAEDAGRALSLAFSPELLADLAAKFPASAARLEAHGVWQGPLEYLTFDDATMTRHRDLRRIRAGQETLEIYFAGREPANLKCSDLLRVSGVRAGTNVAAAEGSLQGSTLAAGACSTLGGQNAVVLLVTFPGVSPPAGVTPLSVQEIFFAPTGRSLDGFWREASYGKAWAQGDVFGWYTLDAAYTCDQPDAMRDAAIRAADAQVDFRQYNRLFVVFPRPAGCSYSGLADLGCMSLTSPGDGLFTASVAWLVADYMTSRDQGVKLATHEAGHNLTLRHAASRDFGSEALGPLGAAGTLSEYGDQFSTMGYWNLGHYGQPHKLLLGWIDGTSNVRTVESSAAFALEPSEVSPPGLQALKVRRGTGNDAWLWVEYRQPRGLYDSTLSSQVFSGALIHYQDSTTGTKTHLLDFTPQTDSWLDPALTAGKSWTDPYSNVSLYVQDAASSALSVQVNYGAVPCTTANPSVTVAPANPSVPAGNSVQYTVTVSNQDSAGCSPATFSLSSALPSGWASSLSSIALTISPGQSASASMTKGVPADAAPATYEVDAAAARASNSGKGTANCTVTAPPPPLTVSVSVPASTYAPRSTVPITAKVLSGSNPASGASVLFTLTKPGGATTTKTVTADSAGAATWNYKLGPKDPGGVYSVAARATYGSQAATSAPASFTVQ